VYCLLVIITEISTDQIILILHEKRNLSGLVYISRSIKNRLLVLKFKCDYITIRAINSPSILLYEREIVANEMAAAYLSKPLF
jgi:hypothetical protein